MTTCKECGSEISESEAFCPYCGIKIELAPAQESVEDVPAASDPEFESTIVITPGEARAMQDQLSGEVDQTAPPSPFDPPVVERKTAPTLEDIPTPSILSSGTARPTDPDISFAAESTPTKESPVFDEESSVEINEESAEQALSVDETSQAERQVTEIPVFAPVDEGSEDSPIAHADDTVLPGKPDTQTAAPAPESYRITDDESQDVQEPKVPTFDLGPSPVASQQAQVSEAADPKPPEPPQPATSREQ
ncbi:MAG TPA: zinc-ribbon domain-containing protein, partial [Pyrinomonadaceae bacterium]